MDDRRKFSRNYLMYYSRIFDLKTGEVLGYLVDLTPEGAMILTEKSIETGQIYRLRLDLPDGLAKKKALDFEAQSIWCKPDIDPQFFGTGFKILNLSDEDLALIEKMIQNYGFRSG